MSNITDIKHSTNHKKIAVIYQENPPVNAMSQAMRGSTIAALKAAQADDSIDAIILTGRGKFFCAGADISEFISGVCYESPNHYDLLDTLQNSNKLIVAAINGTALGGGCENALACHYRIAEASATIGVPEVHLGIFPAGRGSQHLPRLIGAEKALDMMISGKPVKGKKALEIGLVNRTSEGDLLTDALNYVDELLAEGASQQEKLPHFKNMKVEASDELLSATRANNAKRLKGFNAPEIIVQAVEAARDLPYKEALKKEFELFQQCVADPQARAQQHLFFAERAATQIPGVDKSTTKRDIKKVAIIGSGTMGGGIAMNFINAGIETVILDLNGEALERGLGVIRKNYEISAQRGRMSMEQVDQTMNLLKGSTNYQDIRDVDLVIEAVFENMEVKKKVFTTLDEVCKPGCIMASNTSTLDVDEIAAVTSRPEDVIGLHFFSPANVMKLLEIVRAEHTSAEVITTVLKVAQKIRKIPVVVGVCFGFVGNRMLEPYSREAHRLLLEGASPAQVDTALTDFGLKMGCLSMYDLAGIDIGYLVRQSRRDELAHDPSYQIIGDKLHELGRDGQKTSRGFYLYEGRNQIEDPEVSEIAAATAKELGIARREISTEEIIERCIYTLINEGADILHEGIAYRSGDCDIVWCNGYGFPAFLGGPMQYADEIGLEKVLARINHYRETLGEYGEMSFKPSPLLEKLVNEGKKFKDFHENLTN